MPLDEVPQTAFEQLLVAADLGGVSETASETQHGFVHVHPTQKKKYESWKINRKSTTLATEKELSERRATLLAGQTKR